MKIIQISVAPSVAYSRINPMSTASRSVAVLEFSFSSTSGMPDTLSSVDSETDAWAMNFNMANVFEIATSILSLGIP